MLRILLSLAALCATAARADLVISEFCASNDSTLVDGLGDASDWIEIHNPAAAAVALAGWQLRDSTATWTFPAQTLAAGGFLVVFASDKQQQPYIDAAGNLHTSFKLDAAGESLALLRPDGTVAHEFATPVPVQKKDISYGLTQTTTPLFDFESPARILVPSASVGDAWRSDPAFNDSAWTAGKASAGFGSPGFGASSGVVAYRVLSGTNGNQNYGGSLGMDFIVNETLSVSDLGCFDSGANGISGTIVVQLWRRNDAGTPAVFTDDTGLSVLASATFTTASPGTLIEGSRYKSLATPLTLAPGAYTIVAWGYNASEPNGNAGASPATAWETNSAGGKLGFVGGSRFGGAGAYPTSIDGGPANRYAAGSFKFAGPNDPAARTNLQAAMQSVNATALMRIPFTIANPSAFDSLLLDLPFDDGCVVWLNGSQVAAFNAPAALPHNAAATTAMSARITVPTPAALLVPGTNLIAIHGLNATAPSAEFFMGSRLSAVRTDRATVRYFETPTPGAPNPSTGISGYVADTKFSVNRGFHDAPFALAITTTTPGATIRYTLDGTPPSETSGAIYTAPLNISTTTVVRAIASAPGFQATNADTHTYLFASHVAVQPSAAPPGYPATWLNSSGTGTADADYGMIDPAANALEYARSAGSSAYTTQQATAAIAASLKALPVLSIVTDKDDFFDPATGIYLNPGARGDAWERKISLEMITADHSEEFQVDAGIHIMGLTSRSLTATPKLNMMLVFSKDYGPNWLNHDFFGPDGPGRHKRIALRSNTRDSWLAEHYGPATYLVDGWAKQSQLDSGHPATRHRFCHVFINGMYWGLYNPTERPQEHWMETTFGGEDEDYDVINLCCGNRLDAGDFTEWNDLMTRSTAGFAATADYQSVQGNNPDGTRNPAFKKLLGTDSAIGFFINGYYTANGDWPGNFFAAYDNTGAHTQGWRFVTWDNDLGFQGFNVNANKVTPPEGFANQWWLTSPGTVDVGLRQNPDYRMRLADTVYRWFFHGGPYDSAASQARWDALKAKIQPGLYAESCRWGDYRGALKTVQDNWLPRVSATASSYFANRSAVVLAQIRTAGLYPALDPPEFNQHGGVVPHNFALTFSAATGTTIHYTINGSDPRQPGGAIAPGVSTAIPGGGTTLTQTCTVRARGKNGTGWSALKEVTFIVGNAANAGELMITEFDYHPADPTTEEFSAGHTGTSAFEFIELTNISTDALDLTGVHFTSGIQFAFPAGRTLAAGASVLIVKRTAAFLTRYGSALAPLIAGEFAEDSGLSDNGESIALASSAGIEIFSLTYSDAAPWHTRADGLGHSLVVTGTNPADPAHWRTSLGVPTPGERVPHYEEWRRHYFDAAERLNPAISDDLADPDHDGVFNLAEFATASDPRNPAIGPNAMTAQFQQITINGATATYPTVTFRRTTDASVAVTLQTANVPGAWNSAGAGMALAGSVDSQDGYVTETWRTEQPLPTTTQAAFWRLRVSK